MRWTLPSVVVDRGQGAAVALASDFFDVAAELSDVLDDDVDESFFASLFVSPAVPSAFAGVAFDDLARLSVL